MQITISCHAYAPDWMDLERVLAGTDTPCLTLDAEFLGESDTAIGTAVLTIEVGTRDELAAKQIDRLQTILQNVRAESQKRENAILDRITKLQSLTYEPA